MLGVGLSLLLAAIDVSPPEVRLDGKVEVAYGPEATGFAPAPGIINDGLTGRTVWVRFTVENPTDAPIERWLELDNPTLDEIRLNDGKGERVTGRSHPTRTRDAVRPSFAFQLDLPPRTARALTLKIDSENEMLVPLAMWAPTALFAKDARMSLWAGLLFGVVLAAALINLFHYVFLRERARLYYVGGVVLMALWVFVIDGAAVTILPLDWSASRWLYFGPPLAGMLCHLFFVRELLGLKQRTPRLDRAVRAYFVALALGVCGAWAVSWRLQNVVSSALLPITFLIFIALGVMRVREGYRPAVWFVIAWSAFTLFMGLATAVATGLALPSMRIFLHVGIATEAVLLSLALADAARRRDLHVARLQEASARFVPSEFLSLLGKTELPEVRQGDQTERELSVFFLDIRSFTPLVEGMSPADTIALVNQLFGRLEPAIAKEGGFIDKYIGDAVMALFDQPDGAVRAALGCLAALKGFNEGRAKPVSIGIGIHTGRVVLGTVGGKDRLSCTVIGDTVNLASRIEGATKAYCADVLITGTTAEALKGAIAVRRVDRIGVKGRVQPVEVYDVVETSPDFAEGQGLYAKGDFAGATASFEKHVQRAPADKTAAVLLDRCRAYAAAPPPTWDGVARLT